MRVYLVSIVELVIHEPSDDAGFSSKLIPKEDEFIFRERRNNGSSNGGGGGDHGPRR